MDDLSIHVSMTEFRDNLAAYLDLIERGKTVTITRRGKPSAELEATEQAEAIDIEGLEAFRTSLGIQVEASAVLEARRGERY